MSLAARARLVSDFLKHVLLILFNLQGSQPLQVEVFHKFSLHCQQCIPSRNSLIEAILETPSHKGPGHQMGFKFCIEHLEWSLRQIAAAERFGRPDRWQHWVVLADQSNDSRYLQLVFHYALSCVCSSVDIRSQVEERCIQQHFILQNPAFWQQLVHIASKRNQRDLFQILRPLKASLKNLADKIALETLTAQEILDAGSLHAWKNQSFIELLSQERPAEQLQPKMENMIRKIQFVKQFEEAVNNKLPSLIPGAQNFGAILRRAFLKASNIRQSVSGHPELLVEMTQVDDEAWSEEFTEEKPWWDDELQLSHDYLPMPSFRKIESAIQILHLARSERYKPLRSLFEEVETKLATGGCEMKVLDTIFCMQNEIVRNLEQLSELGCEAGLPPQILQAIEKHWSGVAPDMVPETLLNIHRMTSFFHGDLMKIQDRLVAVLRGRQTAQFWKLCRKIEDELCSVLPNKSIPSGFSVIMQRQAHSLKKMQDTIEAASEETGIGLRTEDLDSVSRATQRTQELFDFLGQGGLAFEMVFRLVASMADVPGLSFLKVLLKSVQKGEHLGTRLAELLEGALTHEVLDSVEQASVWFMPLCIAVLAAMDIRIDSSKFGGLVGNFWSVEICNCALQARSQADIGALMLKLLAEALGKDGNKLPDRIQRLRSALRHGELVRQKLEESLDDGTAVSNTVLGMVTSGHLQLCRSADAMHFDVAGIFHFNKSQEIITRDMEQLTECSHKASLAVPKDKIGADKETALTPEKVQLFTACVEGIIGLRQELTELFKIGHPYLEGKDSFRFPEEGEGLSVSTLQHLTEWLKWAQEAKTQWCSALDEARSKHAIMSCIPARNILKITLAVLYNQPGAVPPLLSLAVPSPGCFEPDPDLNDALKQCQFFHPKQDAHERFLERLVEMLTAQLVPEGALLSFPALHKFARNYPKSRLPDDSTLKSRMERRTDPKFHLRRILLIQEEMSHETGSPLQSTAAITVLSVLLPLGVGPGPENLLLCDSRTTKDDVLRFLHRVIHATRSAYRDGCQAQVLGVFVHVDRLQVDVRQVLESKVQAMQVAVGVQETGPACGAEIEVRLVFTVTSHAPKVLIESLEKDLCKLQQIKMLKLASIQHFLTEAAECLGVHHVVTSDFAGDGKTHAIRMAAGWDEASHCSILWGGAQTRGQAARAFKGAGAAGCVHLEVHSFEEGGGVDADTLLLELLLFRCVFDPENSEWVRLSLAAPIFVEVANSINIKHGAAATQLTLLSAPVLQCMPGQVKIDSNKPFSFGPRDLDPATAPVGARNFALAGSALLLGDERRVLVGSQSEADAVFQLLADSAGTVVAGKHADILQFRCNDVVEAAQSALQAAWDMSQGADAGRNQAPLPSKATIMSFLTFLAHLTTKWVHHTFHFEQTFQEVRDVDIHGTLLPILFKMIGMGAATCLRSSAAEAQNQQRHVQRSETVQDEESMSLSEAMACRVLDGRAAASTVWAFNTGGSLRFIGNRGQLPAGLKDLWRKLRMAGQRIEEPPVDLGNATQESLRKLLLDVMSGHGLKKEELKDAFRGFVLTKDNMVKLVDVAERLRASLSCILMGEAGCGKTVLLRLTARLLGAGKLDEQQVHAGTTEAQILDALDAAEHRAREQQESRKDGSVEQMVVQFWDELNTCPWQPLFKKILVDRINPRSGRAIHSGLRFVAACNPWRRACKGTMVSVGFESPVSADDRLAGLAYRVHPIPESLFGCLSSFGQLDSETEAEYVREMASQSPQLLNPDNCLLPVPAVSEDLGKHVASYVSVLHQYFRTLGSCVSLRDPTRLLRLWGFIRWEMAERSERSRNRAVARMCLPKHQLESLVLALHLTYEVTRLQRIT
eukprot:s32_g21.t1